MDELKLKEVDQAFEGALVARINEVRFAWKPGAPDVLNGMRLELRRGERCFIGGPSGGGKTTLLSLVAGIIVPRSGSVELMGTSLGELGGAARDRFRADHIGYIHQMFNLVPYLSVEENVMLSSLFSNRRKQRAIERAESPRGEVHRLLERLGLSGAELARRSVSELSVGQQQRVAAARALFGRPEILIADEPTSALDMANREAFIELLFSECAAADTTLLFVSHDQSLASMFDRAEQLEGGALC